MTPRVEDFAKCGCGQTQDPDGLCDGSHAFIEEHDDSDAESVFDDDDDEYHEETPLEVVFVPGCFDDFDGTQEELDALVLEIQRIAASGKFLENAKVIDYDRLLDEEPEIVEVFLKKSNKRDLQ
jgi:hypothetical protein